jgi:hypothetical protein
MPDPTMNHVCNGLCGVVEQSGPSQRFGRYIVALGVCVGARALAIRLAARHVPFASDPNP